MSQTEEQPVLKSWSTTKRPVIWTQHAWKIANVLHQRILTSPKDFVLGTKISVPIHDLGYDLDSLHFRLHLHPPYNDEIGVEDFVSLYLTSMSPLAFNVDFSATIATSNMKQWVDLEEQSKAFKPTYSEKSWGYKHAFKINDLKVWANEVAFPNDNIEILFNMKIIMPEKHTSSSLKNMHDKSLSLSEDIARGFGDPTLCDVVFVCQDKEFPCHKFILAQRSPVFGAMFKNPGVVENINNKVVIKDIKPNILEEFLRFIYTDEVPKMRDFRTGLLKAADKYMVPKLKNLVCASLYEDLNARSAAKVLILAHTYKADELRSNVVEFIARNFEEVQKSANWSVVLTHHQEVVTEVMLCMSKLI